MPAPKRAVLSLQVEGVEVLANKLDPHRLYDRPVGALLDEAARLGQRQAAKRAPNLSGRLSAAVRAESHATATPPYALLTANVSHGAFRYGFALDASPKFHYRGKKRATKGWFSKVPAIIRRLIRQQLKRAEKEIETQFDQKGTLPV